MNRRSFITTSAIAGAGMLMWDRAPGADAAPAALKPAAKKIPIGLEMYSVRNALMRDLPGTVREVARVGYETVEFYAPYYQWTFAYAKEVRTLLDELGLKCLSTHNNIASLTAGPGMDKAIELNQILGTKVIVLASAPGSTRSADAWKKLAEQLTAAVETLKPHGLTTGFHNHQTEWTPLEGGPSAMEILADNTPKEFVLQLDVGTAVEAKVDTIAWIKSHPGRIRSVHLKDWAPGTAQEEKSYRVLFGEGAAPWKPLIAAAEEVGGVENYLMEQEGSRYSELDTIARCLESWRTLRA